MLVREGVRSGWFDDVIRHMRRIFSPRTRGSSREELIERLDKLELTVTISNDDDLRGQSFRFRKARGPNRTLDIDIVFAGERLYRKESKTELTSNGKEIKIIYNFRYEDDDKRHTLIMWIIDPETQWFFYFLEHDRHHDHDHDHGHPQAHEPIAFHGHSATGGGGREY
ncbi:hypothetical protein SG34_026540 [Thalassomonas viridans]|uniref:Uncharacterized protein n=1 Tax=Thalassomonas viridans TaxID=137584 RepID=A0AAF0C9F1_9GAMM|nr:hypothetical protein [Thalassomonas viridans]WDE04829.1 hypothetical protein SG34_026540 [Thalassomonas viridans]